MTSGAVVIKCTGRSDDARHTSQSTQALCSDRGADPARLLGRERSDRSRQLERVPAMLQSMRQQHRGRETMNNFRKLSRGVTVGGSGALALLLGATNVL